MLLEYGAALSLGVIPEQRIKTAVPVGLQVCAALRVAAAVGAQFPP